MEPFFVKDCALITCMGGVEPAMNLRELRERIAVCPAECLYHHFCETVLRPTFDDPEFRNDFALWAARELRDRPLAERLGSINPYKSGDIQQLRGSVLEIIDDRLNEVSMIPWAPRGSEFRMMRAVSVVFDSGLVFADIEDFRNSISQLTTGSIYYHFVSARLRTPGHIDDFSAWLAEYGESAAPLISALASLDFYYLTLPELKRAMMAIPEPSAK